ncbi:cobalt-precorrin-6A reductase [Gordonia sp. HNM0687]|uniref:Cobalt-precorrin-6A reductase n=1 Tax=Gordonia mangrovi TaxID=2665643 RepID=A0A6L7GTX0_9ACTN|nr:cobalt-precorrin-6A reductase [Gordonia mangrovi]MDY6808833.1 cobalt-precorrin-6A reductase [Actinomycetota bacterium]MXP22125.1 cobalt-precorrin-6A reductase [Gordonia mangrovi]UVF77961.1 cobalt-precorrin-6A reductase [Gordonia mangrovi]
MAERRVLVLGGTGEARDLAARLSAADIPVISSLAGRVRDPRLPVGDVRIGGFGGVDGLAAWVRDNDIAVIVDATHPFARTMSEHAAAAVLRVGTPLVRLRRPAWEPGTDDSWETVRDMGDAARAVTARSVAHRISAGLRVFLTTGRQDVGVFADNADAWFLIRVVDPPTCPLPPRHHILRSRGPYDLSGERNLLRENSIDVLVTKNSGGDLTRAKLTAAAELGVPVVMVQRPPEPTIGTAVDTVPKAMEWISTLGA